MRLLFLSPLGRERQGGRTPTGVVPIIRPKYPKLSLDNWHLMSKTCSSQDLNRGSSTRNTVEEKVSAPPLLSSVPYELRVMKKYGCINYDLLSDCN